jgi:hypothetical protein
VVRLNQFPYRRRRAPEVSPDAAPVENDAASLGSGFDLAAGPPDMRVADRIGQDRNQAVPPLSRSLDGERVAVQQYTPAIDRQPTGRSREAGRVLKILEAPS